MIADVDKDGSGAIDFDEFVHMMTAKMGERDSKEELTKAFQIIDQDKNVNLVASLLSTPNFECPALGLYINYYCILSVQGKISIADIQRIAKELGEAFTEREIHEMIEEADRDREYSS